MKKILMMSWICCIGEAGKFSHKLIPAGFGWPVRLSTTVVTAMSRRALTNSIPSAAQWALGNNIHKGCYRPPAVVNYIVAWSKNLAVASPIPSRKGYHVSH